MTRNVLVDALRLHGAEIREADEWRPLADHVLALIDDATRGLRDELVELQSEMDECAMEEDGLK